MKLQGPLHILKYDVSFQYCTKPINTYKPDQFIPMYESYHVDLRAVRFDELYLILININMVVVLHQELILTRCNLLD